MPKLRGYQVEAIDRLHDEISLGKRRLILQLPTGTGKTIIAAEIIKRALQDGNRALFVYDMLTLIEQASEKLTVEGIPHGVIQANLRPHTKLKSGSCLTIIGTEGTVRYTLTAFHYGARFPDPRNGYEKKSFVVVPRHLCRSRQL